MFRWSKGFWLPSLIAATFALLGCDAPGKPGVDPAPSSRAVTTYEQPASYGAAAATAQGFVFDEQNFQKLVGDGNSVVVNGERRYLSRKPPSAAEDQRRRAMFREQMQVIPRSEWSQRIKEQAAAKARVSDYCTFEPYDQRSTNYCWANGPAQAFTTVRLQMGLPYRRISAASIAGPITGYKNVGGWELDAIEYLTLPGGTTEEAWPNAAISKALNTTAVSADRENYTALEWVELEGFDEFATAALEGRPCAVAYNWWRHVVMSCDLVEISPGKFGLLIRNSWGKWGVPNEAGFYGFAVLAEGKGTPSSGFMLRQVRPSARPTISQASLAATLDGSGTIDGVGPYLRDGVWRFDQTDGVRRVFLNGKWHDERTVQRRGNRWFRCNGSSCEPLSAAETQFALAV